MSLLLMRPAPHVNPVITASVQARTMRQPTGHSQAGGLEGVLFPLQNILFHLKLYQNTIWLSHCLDQAQHRSGWGYE
ncbi:hypothetical protein [Mycobacterium asiaticum]|uniref:hypothetical protein n=1 Tax=Mycobacterium asiaticum TaxID=1790 RepID=UPI0012DB46B7